MNHVRQAFVFEKGEEEDVYVNVIYGAEAFKTSCYMEYLPVHTSSTLAHFQDANVHLHLGRG